MRRFHLRAFAVCLRAEAFGHRGAHAGGVEGGVGAAQVEDVATGEVEEYGMGEHTLVASGADDGLGELQLFGKCREAESEKKFHLDS